MFACNHPDSYQCGHRKPTYQLRGRTGRMLAMVSYVGETEIPLNMPSKKGFDIGDEWIALSLERTEKPRPGEI